MTPDKKKQQKDTARALAMVSQVSLSMAGCVVLGFFLGRYLDGLFGTSPWLLLLFSFLGMAAAFKVLYDIGKKG